MALDRAENGAVFLETMLSEGPGNRASIAAIFFGGSGFPVPSVLGEEIRGGFGVKFGGGFFERFGERLW